MSGWLDGFEVIANPNNPGGGYEVGWYPYPWRLLLHTVEGYGIPDPSSFPYNPHVWYDRSNGRRRVQAVPLDKSCYALFQPPLASQYTNRARCIQTEIVGFAAEAGGWSDDVLHDIAEDVVVPQVKWVRANGGDIDLTQIAAPGIIPGSASEDAPQRLSWDVWASFNGVLGHRHAPGQEHWDAGLLDMAKIAGFARVLLGDTEPDEPKEDDMAMMRQFRVDGTVWAVFGIFKTPLNDDALRVSMMDMGILAPPDEFFEQNPWTLNELVEVNPRDVQRLLAPIGGTRRSNDGNE